jgi:tetratricopeptide (TPR) repeat protein
MAFGARLIVLGLSSLALLSCSSSRPSASNQEKTLQQSMSKFRSELLQLAPFLYSASQYSDPKNQDEILGHLNELKAEVRSVNHEKAKTFQKKDPSLGFAMKEMSSLLDLGVTSFREGKKEFSRTQVKKSLGQCFYCHTRTAEGSTWLGGEYLTDIAWASPLDQANFLVALRNFNGAIDVLMKSLKDKSLPSPLARETATRKLMALSVRVEQDPKGLLKTVEQLEKVQGLPESLRSSFPAWKKDIRSWQALPKTSEARLQLAEKLIAQDQERGSGELSGDILLLRASQILHSELEQDNQTPTQKAEVLFLLGQCYERLMDLGFWELNESYYETCIELAPHTPQAQKCLEAWDQSMVVGYSGSAGTHIPPPVAKRRTELMKLASPSP